MQPLQICIGPIIRIGRESWCLPYAGFYKVSSYISLVILEPPMGLKKSLLAIPFRNLFHKQASKSNTKATAV